MSLTGAQDAVVADLSASLSLPSEKAFTPEITLESTEILRVIVVPLSIESVTRLTRGNDWEELPIIQIGVARRVQPNAGTPVSAQDILDVAESIRTHYKSNPFVTDLGGVRYTVLSVNYFPFYDYEELDDSLQVISIIQINFKEFTQ